VTVDAEARGCANLTDAVGFIGVPAYPRNRSSRSLATRSCRPTASSMSTSSRASVSRRSRSSAVYLLSHRTELADVWVPRMHAELCDQGVHVARKRVARLMRELGIEGVSRRRGRKRTTVQAEAAKAAPDLLERRFSAERPDQVWVADITYIPIHEGWLFLAAVVDLCSRRVVGWSMRGDLDADLVVDAGSIAIAR
jgi:putative transposase